MKKITALLILLCCGLLGFSQKVYFMYLQSEGAQPFFLKMNEQVYSSNSSGYLILSRLKDSTYNFSIGFPQNKWPEQAFTVPVAGRDKGFLLKNAGVKEWGLIDLQTEQKIDGQLAGKQRSVKTEPKEVSAFTEVLSKAANDPSLKERVVPVQPAMVKKEEKPVVTPAVTKTDTTETAPPTVTAAVKTAGQQLPAGKDTLVKRQPEVVATTPVPEPSVPKTMVDSGNAIARDTLVRTVIPELQMPPLTAEKKIIEEKKTELEPVKQEVAAVAPPLSADTVSKMQPQIKTEEQPLEVQAVVYKPSVVKRRKESSTTEGFGVTYVDEYPDGKKDTIQIFIPNPKSVIRNVPPPQEEGQFLPMDSEAKDLTPAKKEQVNGAKNNCSSMASETDYLKLRKKMVATDGDDAMLAAAKKIFKTKCFTTEQLKNLGTLFLNDAGRYNFFDAAYLAVSDRENFSGLEAELKDAYYVSRFKAMLR